MLSGAAVCLLMMLFLGGKMDFNVMNGAKSADVHG